VLNPGAGWPSKLWPLDRYAAVARHLADRGLGSVVVWGSDRERAWAESIVSAAKASNVLVAPPTSLPELTAVLKAARLFIGSDTGPLHLAAAVGTPSIGLFGSSLGSSAGPYGFGQITLQSAFDNSPTRKRRGADNWAMRRIGVEMVTRACDEQLQRPAKDAA
jgi:ADP-heptose:LPS heptosyltransferase